MSNEQSMAEQIKADSAQRGEDRRLIDLQAMEIARLREVALALGKRAADTFSDLVESNEDRERLREQVRVLRDALTTTQQEYCDWICERQPNKHTDECKEANAALASTEPRP